MPRDATATETFDASAMPRLRLGRPAAHHSLGLRLSLLTTLLVAGVLAVFLFASNRALTRATLQAGNERALAASAQIAAVLGQNSLRGLTELRRLSADPVLSAFIAEPNDELRQQVLRRLAPMAQPGQGPVALLDSSGRSVLQVEGPNTILKKPITGVPTTFGVGPMQSSDEGIFADVVTSVATTASNAAEARQEAPPAGYLIVRRTLRAGANADTVNRLVGAGAIFAIGNRTGGVWTDLSRQIPAPPVDASNSGIVHYRTPQGEQRTAGLATIEGTPWAVWLDFGENLVLAPARVAITRMAYLALFCIGLAIVAGGLLSRHIVGPLDELTRASERMAAGALDARVQTTRRDEIGRLATAFNMMSEHVATAQRELEARVQHRTAELEERAAELAALNRELEAFSYSVSHDLRAPLRHIHGFVGLMAQSSDTRLTDEERRWLNTIASSSSRMGRLIDDLLEFSKTSRATLVRHPVDLNLLAADVRKDIAADNANASIEWRIGPLPTVAADSALLRQVFVNLLSNAVKYSRGRQPQVIEVGTSGDDHGHAVFFVRDNGVGFDMRYAKKLFGVFQRLHSDEQFEGTGIGLANVQRIVHRHGGRVWADARIDEGATFFVALPKA